MLCRVCWSISGCSVKLVCSLYTFFWVIAWQLNFICWYFRTLFLFHLHRWIGVCRIILRTPSRLWRWNRQCSETSAYKIQMPRELPRRKRTTSGTRQKFEIKNSLFVRYTLTDWNSLVALLYSGGAKGNWNSTNLVPPPPPLSPQH